MKKTKNIYKPLVITGYALFAFLFIGVLASTTIPMGSMLFRPDVLHYNVATFTLALTIGALLPFVVGYVAGDHAVKSKSKLQHHFNGVVFGLLAYWLMTLFSTFIILPGTFLDSQYALRAVTVNIIPSLGVAAVTVALAIAHMKSRQARKDVIEYKPFGVVLLAAIIALPVWSLIVSAMDDSVNIYNFVTLAIVLVVGAVSYISLRKTKLTAYKKLVWAGISVSVAFVLSFVSMQVVYGLVTNVLYDARAMELQMVVMITVLLLAAVAWGVYWVKQRKTL